MPSPTTPAHAEVPVHLIVFRAELLHLKDPHADLRFQQLLKVVPPENISDTIQAQLDEYAKLRHPKRKLSAEETRAEVATIVDGSDLHSYGSWAYFAWTNRLVHLLPEAAFAFVRTNRNRNKITAKEQEKLSRLKVGVIGLSVGQSVSLAMALERSFGEIRLADFDTLDLSNLNRLRSGVHNLGVNKAIMTAREIAELDPYLKVVCFTDGLTKENMDTFFTGGGALDVVVEECDSVDIKILARQKAKALGIPVVMDMSDRGCLDVERFDLEPDRPLMHGWIEHLDLDAAARPMTSEEKMPFMVPITGIDTLSPRMKASVIELNQSISTWPQLATSVVLGGALAGDVVRRIALDHFRSSGRWFVDLDELVADPSIEPLSMPSAHSGFRLGIDELQEITDVLGPATQTSCDLQSDTINELVVAGGLAPSAGNMQPWKFLWHDKRLLLFHDKPRSASFWDPDHFIAQIALGACTENIVLKAHVLGLEVSLRNSPVPGFNGLVCVFEFHTQPMTSAEPHVMDHLSSMIGIRCTNRKITEPQPFPRENFQKLDAAVQSMAGCSAQLVTQPEKLAVLARLCGSAERLRLLNPIGHREFFENELRWSPETPQGSTDGLDLASMELSTSNIVGLKVASDRRAMDLIDQWKGGKGLEEISGKAIRASSAVILICTSEEGANARLDGGRAVERLWMSANAAGFSVHPISAPIFMTHMLDLESNGLRLHEQEGLKDIRKEFTALWKLKEEHPLFMVRISNAGQPSMRALRRPVSELFVQPTDYPRHTPIH
ncbi:MAG: Rv1355c family protein [Flavobacteriales bacterium]|nr:Rv1355c family protein [Flavobacteriales bacterium]